MRREDQECFILPCLSEVQENLPCAMQKLISQLKFKHLARCTFRPYFFDLLFNSKICQEGKNKRSSFKDVGNITAYSKVFITVRGKRNHSNFSEYVRRGKIFSVGLRNRADSVLQVYIFRKEKERSFK